MKINCCDMCLASGKLTMSKWTRSYKQFGAEGKLTIMVCNEHQKDPVTRDDMKNILGKAYEAYITL